ncbi:hypothetical protein [Streptomyces sp. SID14515]|uniref:hypothetical protein n=1 Tax=Streptomyces sp. SID14515 TaxID=2706074 RepID=UPI0019422464|nr:hypothetical protein [Streptomyces sp. SID14515]
MTREKADETGASVMVRLDRAPSLNACSVHRADQTIFGIAEFVISPGESEERVFFRTEIYADFDGHGLEGLLVREILSSSIDEKYTIVPLCPLLARHLCLHGEEFVAEGGAFREPLPDDIRLITRAARSAAQDCVSSASVIRRQDFSATPSLPFSMEEDECGRSFPTI